MKTSYYFYQKFKNTWLGYGHLRSVFRQCYGRICNRDAQSFSCKVGKVQLEGFASRRTVGDCRWSVRRGSRPSASRRTRCCVRRIPWGFSQIPRPSARQLLACIRGRDKSDAKDPPHFRLPPDRLFHDPPTNKKNGKPTSVTNIQSN